MLAGFLLGDTRAVPDDVVAAYRNSGLSHLLAVSGENVAFTLALFGPLLRRLSLGSAHDRGDRDRAAVRDDDAFRAVGVARVGVGDRRARVVVRRAARRRACARWRSRSSRCSLLDPFLLHSVAFWLSCGASAGIATARGADPRAASRAAWLRAPLAVSLAAQVGVTPVLLATFGTVPVVTPFANLLAAPAAEAVGVYGMLASAVGGVVPPLAPVLQQPSGC